MLKPRENDPCETRQTFSGRAMRSDRESLGRVALVLLQRGEGHGAQKCPQLAAGCRDPVEGATDLSDRLHSAREGIGRGQDTIGAESWNPRPPRQTELETGIFMMQLSLLVQA